MTGLRMPGVLADLERLVGTPSALAIAEAFGGRRIGFPSRSELDEDHELVKLVGREAASRLTEEFACEKLYIPKFDDYRRRLRNERIRQERAQGLTRDAIASRYHLTERQVTKILQEQDRASGATEQMPAAGLESYRVRLRNRRIRQARSSGVTVTDLAARYGLDEAEIEEILEQGGPVAVQMTLDFC